MTDKGRWCYNCEEWQKVGHSCWKCGKNLSLTGNKRLYDDDF